MNVDPRSDSPPVKFLRLLSRYKAHKKRSSATQDSKNLPTLHKSLPDIMSLLYITILWVCACVDSAESLGTVSAPVGSTVILPCKLTEDFKPTPVITWKINRKDLVFERNSDGTYSGSGYEGRVDVPVDELRKGNCSLVLKNVRFTDDQIYKIFTLEHVDINNPVEVKEINRVRLSVYALQISAPVGSTVVLPCDWSHLSIKTPYLVWFINTETVFERKGKDSHQGEGYEGRVDVPEDELLKGNCSLVLKNIRFSDTGIYSSSMLITDTQKSVLVQKVKLSVVEVSVNERGPSSEDTDSHPTGGRNRIILYVGIGIIIIIIIICVSVYYSCVKGHRRATDSTEQEENFHHDAELQETELQEAELQDAELQDAELQEAELQDAELQDAELHDAEVQDAELQDAELQDAELQEAELQEAELQDAELQDAELQDAELQDAELQDAELQDAELQDTELHARKSYEKQKI